MKIALKNLKTIEESSLEPPKPDLSLHEEDAVKSAVMSVWTTKASRAAKLFSVYEQDLKSLFGDSLTPGSKTI